MNMQWRDIVGICLLFWCTSLGLRGIWAMLIGVLDKSLPQDERAGNFIGGGGCVFLACIFATLTLYWRDWL